MDAEHAECRACDLVVALLGTVVPEWQRPEVARRLEGALDPPAGLDVALVDVEAPRALVATRRTWLRVPSARLSLDRGGVRLERVFRDTRALPLAEVARVVPCPSFDW